MKTNLFLMLILACANIFAKSNPKPNVLLIYTDDHRFSGVHALGGQAVHTPNIDYLVHEGVAFTNTYLMGSFNGGTCVPSRAQLLSGRRLFNLNQIGRTIDMEYQPIGRTFQKAGYHSHVVGKWHNDNKSLGEMFDTGGPIMSRAGYLADHFRMPLWDWRADGKYKKKEGYIYVYDENGNIQKRGIAKTDKKGAFSNETTGPHTSETYATSAIQFLDNYQEKKKPFFMYLAFHAPHDPRQAPKRFKDMYPEDQIQLPPSYVAQHPFDNGHMTNRDEALAPWPRTPEVARKHLSDYYAIITHLDEQIGRVIEALKANGQYENTLIVLSGDSGLAVGNHGLIGKQNVYDEDGIHVPFIISGGLAPRKGKRYNALSYIHDIYPTICDIVGIDAPESIDGKSLKPVIEEKQKQIRDYTYHAYRQHQRAYRKDGYKLIEFVQAPDINRKKEKFISGSRVTLLYNIDKDPWETTNLAFLPEYKEVLERMRKEMKEKSIELNDEPTHLMYPYNFWDFYTSNE